MTAEQKMINVWQIKSYTIENM